MIGFGIKRSSYSQIEFPEFHGFMPALQWRQAVPLPPRILIVPSVFAFLQLVLNAACFHKYSLRRVSPRRKSRLWDGAILYATTIEAMICMISPAKHPASSCPGQRIMAYEVIIGRSGPPAQRMGKSGLESSQDRFRISLDGCNY